MVMQSYFRGFQGIFNHPAQSRHFSELVTGRIVSKNKTIAGIQQNLVMSSTSYDGLRRFTTRSSWSTDAVKDQRLEWAKSKLCGQKEYPTVVSIDGTLVHHTGNQIDGVHKYFDYAEKKYCLGQRLILSCLATPSQAIPLGHRLFRRGYLAEQEEYLEEVYPDPEANEDKWQTYDELEKIYEQNAANYKTHSDLARELVDECEHYKFHKDAYVVDAGLLTIELADHIESFDGAWISRLPKSRLVQATGSQFQSLLSFAKSLSKESFQKTCVKTRHGEEREYWTFSKSVMVKDWKKLRIIISFDNEQIEGDPIFLVTNKKNWTQHSKVLQLYLYRDPIEHLIRDEKQELGFESCQQRTREAVERHWELSFVAHTFLELGFNANPPAEVPTVAIETLGQKSRMLACEVLQDFVTLVRQLVLDERDTKEIVSKTSTLRLNRLAC